LRSDAGRSSRVADATDNVPDRLRVRLTCWSCRHQRDANLAGLVAARHSDVPLIHLHRHGSRCGSARIDMIRTSRAKVLRWRLSAEDHPPFIAT